MPTGLTISSTGLTITCPTGLTLTFSGYTGYCETVPSFQVLKQITSLSSPANVWFDPSTGSSTGTVYTYRYSGSVITGNTFPNGRVWVTDVDNYSNGGNIYWFDPVTATSASHMNYIYSAGTSTPLLAKSNLYSTYIDTKYKKMYYVGYFGITGHSSFPQTPQNNGVIGNVNGMIIYDITANTISQTIHPGGSPSVPNGYYSNGVLFVTDDFIYNVQYTSNTSIQSYVRYPRSGATTANGVIINIPITGTSGIGYDYFLTGGAKITPIGDFFWISSGGGTKSGKLGVFDKSFNLLREYVLDGIVFFTNYFNYGTLFWGGAFYDTFNNNNILYISDYGSNNVYKIKIDATFSGITSMSRFSMSGITESKPYALTSWVEDPVTNYLYANISVQSDVQTVVLNKSYQVRRNSNVNDYFFVNKLNFGVYSLVTATTNPSYSQPSLIGASAGNVYWAANNAGYSTDGSINIFNNSVTSGLNGIYVPTILQEYDKTNGRNIPMGIYTANTTDNPYYIPKFPSSLYCPINTNLACPYNTNVTQYASPNNNKLSYEFSISGSVINNPLLSGGTILFTGLTAGNIPMFTDSIPISYFSGNTSNPIYYYSNTKPTTAYGYGSTTYHLDFKYSGTTGLLNCT